MSESDRPQPPGDATVWAVVVSFNRRELLRECLAALGEQTRAPEHVLVIDNQSTDGTPDMVRAAFPQFELRVLPVNVGSSGGFHAGMLAAYEGGADWAWTMDDDTIPTPAALEELLAAARGLGGLAEPLLLSSRTVWTDGSLHPMNAPTFKRDPAEFVDATERGVVPLRTATFVSLMVHRRAIERFGLPLRHFFIWSDDIEFTARIVRDEPNGFFVPGSVVVHKTKTPHTAVTESGSRFYFHVRNTLYMLRGRSWTPREKLSLLWALFFTTQAYLRLNRFGREQLTIVGRGLRDGVKPLPPA